MKNNRQKEKQKKSTRDLIGIDDLTDYSIKTAYGELVYFIIHPTNISVLSESTVSARIYALMTVLKGIEVIEKNGLHGTEEMNTALEGSDLELTLAILTGYIRQERFCDGLWESAVKDKTFLKILRRLEKLLLDGN